MSFARGVIAGAAGTVALNAVTYLDMAVRGRPPSDVPAQSVEWAARAAGATLGRDEAAAANRSEGLGALLGYATGVVLGGTYGVVAGRQQPSVVTGAVALAAGAMVVANEPLVAMRITDPRTWGVEGWVADLVPHLAYGVVGAVVFAAITPETSPVASASGCSDRLTGWPTSPCRRQAARWPGSAASSAPLPPPAPSPTRTRSGSIRPQAWNTSGQRVRNRQPEGGSSGLGTSPASTTRRRSRSRTGSGTGTADSSARV